MVWSPTPLQVKPSSLHPNHHNFPIANHVYRLQHARLLKRRLHTLANPFATICICSAPQTQRATATPSPYTYSHFADIPTAPVVSPTSSVASLYSHHRQLSSATIDPKLSIAPTSSLHSCDTSPPLQLFRESRFETSGHSIARTNQFHYPNSSAQR